MLERIILVCILVMSVARAQKRIILPGFGKALYLCANEPLVFTIELSEKPTQALTVTLGQFSATTCNLEFRSKNSGTKISSLIFTSTDASKSFDLNVAANGTECANQRVTYVPSGPSVQEYCPQEPEKCPPLTNALDIASANQILATPFKSTTHIHSDLRLAYFTSMLTICPTPRGDAQESVTVTPRGDASTQFYAGGEMIFTPARSQANFWVQAAIVGPHIINFTVDPPTYSLKSGNSMQFTQTGVILATNLSRTTALQVGEFSWPVQVTMWGQPSQDVIVRPKSAQATMFPSNLTFYSSEATVNVTKEFRVRADALAPGIEEDINVEYVVEGLESSGDPFYAKPPPVLVPVKGTLKVPTCNATVQMRQDWDSSVTQELSLSLSAAPKEGTFVAIVINGDDAGGMQLSATPNTVVFKADTGDALTKPFNLTLDAARQSSLGAVAQPQMYYLNFTLSDGYGQTHFTLPSPRKLCQILVLPPSGLAPTPPPSPSSDDHPPRTWMWVGGAACVLAVAGVVTLLFRPVRHTGKGDGDDLEAPLVGRRGGKKTEATAMRSTVSADRDSSEGNNSSTGTGTFVAETNETSVTAATVGSAGSLLAGTASAIRISRRNRGSGGAGMGEPPFGESGADETDSDGGSDGGGGGSSRRHGRSSSDSLAAGYAPGSRRKSARKRWATAEGAVGGAETPRGAAERRKRESRAVDTFAMMFGFGGGPPGGSTFRGAGTHAHATGQGRSPKNSPRMLGRAGSGGMGMAGRPRHGSGSRREIGEGQQSSFHHSRDASLGTMASDADEEARLFGSVTGFDSSEAETWHIYLDELDLHEEVGTGASAQVFRGFYFGQEVAIKRLFCSVWEESKFEEFFRNEAQLLATLHHPNVIRFYGAAFSAKENRGFLVTEFAQRGSLAAHIARNTGEVGRHRFFELTQAICHGMQFFHAKGVVHRDLKPDNVLLDENSNVKLCDFGLSRFVQDSLNNTMTAGIGTPAFMAIELIVGQESSVAAGTAVDVFSFGILMWVLWTHRIPYNDHKLTPFTLMNKVVNGLRPALPPEMPPRLQMLMQSCWAESPAARPTFAEAIQELSVIARTAPLLEAEEEEEPQEPQIPNGAADAQPESEEESEE